MKNKTRGHPRPPTPLHPNNKRPRTALMRGPFLCQILIVVGGLDCFFNLATEFNELFVAGVLS